MTDEQTMTYRAIHITTMGQKHILGVGLTKRRADDLLLQALQYKLTSMADSELTYAGYERDRNNILRRKTQWLEAGLDHVQRSFRFMDDQYLREVEVARTPPIPTPVPVSLATACQGYLDATQRIKDAHMATLAARKAYDAAREAERTAVADEVKAYEVLTRMTKGEPK